MHQRPHRSGHKSYLVGCLQDFIAQTDKRWIQQQRVEPIITSAMLRLDKDPRSMNRSEPLMIALGQLPFAGDGVIQVFHLRTTKSSIDVGQPVIEAKRVMIELPRMGAP